MSRALETKVKKKKRATTIFTTMSVAHVDDEDDDDKDNDMDTPGQHVEKVFPSGDIYMGQWGQNSPNGHGKCVWSDGCMYVGDWSNGKANGKGKFSWPSGATYEGHFKNGFMEGHGVYTGTSNDTYKGSWLCNTRHDDGVQSYGNGDYYEGQFRLGELDGKGRYQWRNGNEYMGHWRDGKMHGNGIMVWSNGNRYEGSWANGVPRGNGKFSWDDGSFYVGIWSEDSRKQRGTYYTSSSQIGGFDRDPNDAYLMDLSDCCVASIEKIPVFPCQKMTNMCVEIHETMKLQPQLVVRPAKRQGITISKGHKNYELMLNLQLGIRHSVGRCGPATSVDLKASEFDPKDKIWTRFAPQGSKHTPPHHSCEFKWKDYCPLVFRTLRKLFKVDPGDYMLSICGNDALRELSSPGKSGSFFYITSDDKYLIKTMKKSEVKVRVLLRMLPDYYNHVRSHENTLVTKFFGLHCVKMNGPIQKKVRFVIMGNLFCTQHTIHRRFDLKGSSHGRSSLKHDTDIVDSSTTLKDLDLNFIFRLQSSWFQHFCRQVKQDCEFLEQERIMDYSLLVGIHFRQVSDSGEAILHHGHANNNNNNDNDNVSEVIEPRLGCNMGARAEVITVRRNNAEQAQYYEVVLVMGIIDILQDYDISKKLEHAYKSLQYDAVSISAVDPAQYSKRFLDFIFRIFRQEDM